MDRNCSTTRVAAHDITQYYDVTLALPMISGGPNGLDLDIVPAGWAFSIWGLIYLTLFAIAIYALTLACRSNPLTSGHLYYDPPFLPPTFWAILTISNVFNVGWLYIIDENYLWAAFITLVSLWLCVQICLIFAIR